MMDDAEFGELRAHDALIAQIQHDLGIAKPPKKKSWWRRIFTFKWRLS